MKILFLSQIVPYPPHGGVLQRSYNIIHEIAKNHEVYLLAFIHPDRLTVCENAYYTTSGGGLQGGDFYRDLMDVYEFWQYNNPPDFEPKDSLPKFNFG